MSIKTNIFDIETSPRTDLVIEFTKPFKRSDVKLGNIKDPEKVAAKMETAEADYWHKANDKCQLNPFTSEICAIGVHIDGAPDVALLDGSEIQILSKFWSLVAAHNSERWAYYTGSNNKSAFDPRHIICRSWVNGVSVPEGMVSEQGYLSRCFVDLAQVFLAGADYPSFVGADLCAKQLGLIGQDVGFSTVKSKDQLSDSDGLTGKNFWKFWQGDDVAKTLAAEYLTNDLAIERAIADRILS
jgi:hypothetical protein